MNIQEAVKKAAKAGTTLRRKSFPKGIICVLPTNTVHGCLLVSAAGSRRALYRWQPTLDDLTAGDWEVDEKADGLLQGKDGTDDGNEVTDDETAEVLEPD